MQRAQEILEVVWERLYQWRRVGATAALCVIAVWVGFHVVFGANGMMVYAEKRAEHRELTKQIQDLKQENERLQKNVNALKTDPHAIEKEAREQLRLARPGEVIYTVPAPKNPSTITAQKH